MVVQLLAHGFSDGAQRRGGAIPGRIELGFGIRRLLRGSLVLVPAGSEVLLRAPQLAPGFVRVATRLLLAGEQSCVLACPQGPQRVFRRSNSGGRARSRLVRPRRFVRCSLRPDAGLAGCCGGPAALQLESDKLIAGHFLRLAPCFPELVYYMAQDVQLGGEIGEIAADPLDRSKR